VIITLEPDTAARYLVLLDLGTVLDAANAWFFGIAPTAEVWPVTGLPVWLGLVSAVAIAVGTSAILVQRYRTISA
jgi:hypothetical protein